MKTILTSFTLALGLFAQEPLAEIATLKRDVLQQRLDFQQWKVRALSITLQQVQAGRQQTQEQLAAVQREIADLEISLSASPGQDAPELHALRDKLQKGQLPRIETDLQQALQRESSVSRELAEEKQRAGDTQTRLNDLRLGTQRPTTATANSQP